MTPIPISMIINWARKAKRWNDDLQTRVGYEFIDKYRILAYYNYFTLRYDLEQDYSQNYDNNEVGAGVEMRVTPLTWAFLRFHTGERDYTSHPASVPDFSEANDADLYLEPDQYGNNLGRHG